MGTLISSSITTSIADTTSIPRGCFIDVHVLNFTPSKFSLNLNSPNSASSNALPVR